MTSLAVPVVPLVVMLANVWFALLRSKTPLLVPVPSVTADVIGITLLMPRPEPDARPDSSVPAWMLVTPVYVAAAPRKTVPVVDLFMTAEPARTAVTVPACSSKVLAVLTVRVPGPERVPLPVSVVVAWVPLKLPSARVAPLIVTLPVLGMALLMP